MLKKIMMASVAVGALALNAPIASANSHLGGDCGFNAVQQDDATGQTFEGAAYGYGTNSNGGDVTVRCDVVINEDYANPVSSTPTGGPTPGVATTAGRVSFVASDSDKVELCAVVSDPATGETATFCGTSSSQEIPPPEFWQALDGVLWTVWNLVDPIVCEELKKGEGSYGNVSVNSEGDVFVDGELWYDCPPYATTP